MRRLLQASFLALAAFGVTVVFVELALRLTGAAPERGGVFTVSSAEFEQVPGIFGRNQDAEVSPVPELPYRVRIDSLGYRGEHVPRSKPEGEIRILYAGDSFVFGDFVDDEETLPALTEDVLAARCSQPVRVINAGLGGSTITEHAEMIERGLTLGPDLVILQFSENDVSDLAGAAMWDELAQNRLTKGRFPLSIVYPVVRSTALWNLALRVAARFRERAVAERYSGSEGNTGGAGASATAVEVGGAPASTRYREEYRERLTKLHSSLGARGIPFLMTVMPSHLSVYNQRESDQLDWLDVLMGELGIDGVSFLPTFQADGRDETELYLLPHDGHASPEGYRIAAHRLVDRLITLGPLLEHCR